MSQTNNFCDKIPTKHQVANLKNLTENEMTFFIIICHIQIHKVLVITAWRPQQQWNIYSLINYYYKLPVLVTNSRFSGFEWLNSWFEYNRPEEYIYCFCFLCIFINSLVSVRTRILVLLRFTCSLSNSKQVSMFIR